MSGDAEGRAAVMDMLVSVAVFQAERSISVSDCSRPKEFASERG